MEIIAILAAISAVLTQILKRYVTWAKANPKLVVIGLTALGTVVAFRVFGVPWFWTFLLGTLAAVGVYEYALKR